MSKYSSLKKEIKKRITVECDQCKQTKFKKEFSYLNTYRGNICSDCQEQDNY